MALRAHPQNVEFSNRLKFGTELSYTTDHPKETLEEENYFLPCHHLVERGDELRVIVMRDDGTWDKALFEVSLSSKTRVSVERITPWRHGGLVIIRGLKAVHAGWGKWRVEDDAGHEVAKGLTKEEASAFINSVKPADAPIAGETLKTDAA